MQTRSTFKVSKKAKLDLEAIWLYGVDNWSLRHAESYVARLYTAFDFLGAMPSAGRPAANFRSGYFRHEIKSHTIFYQIGERHITIIRVLHEKMDPGRHL